MVYGPKGTERCLVYVGPRFGPLTNNMLLCVKKNHVNIYICLMYWHGNCDEWKLYVENIIIWNLSMLHVALIV